MATGIVQTNGTDEHVFLNGRPPLAEYLQFIALEASNGQGGDRGRLVTEWRAANARIRELEELEAGLADGPTIGHLSQQFEPLRDQVFADPIFARVFSTVPVEIGMVELDRLVVFQKHINLDHVRRVQEHLGSTPSDAEVFRLCLPFDHPQPPIVHGQVAPNAFIFQSPSNDLRFLEPIVLQSADVPGYSPLGPVTGVVGLVVGFGSNFLNAIHAEGRLILNNGSHRAYALRDLGITHAPCIIQIVSHREELAVVASGELPQSPDKFLTAVRPPLLKDYFDPALRKIVSVPRRNHQVRVSFGIEPLNIPA